MNRRRELYVSRLVKNEKITLENARTHEPHDWVLDHSCIPYWSCDTGHLGIVFPGLERRRSVYRELYGVGQDDLPQTEKGHEA